MIKLIYFAEKYWKLDEQYITVKNREAQQNLKCLSMWQMDATVKRLNEELGSPLLFSAFKNPISK